MKRNKFESVLTRDKNKLIKKYFLYFVHDKKQK